VPDRLVDVVGALVQVGGHGVPSREPGVDGVQGGKSRTRPVDLPDGDGAVERDDGAVREPGQLVVPLQYL
jgi:hypothetical protein